MHHIVLPFALSANTRTKAVSEQTFTIQSQRSQFRGVSIAQLSFMTVYEQERYNMTQWPFNETWANRKSLLDGVRQTASLNGFDSLFTARNDLQFGNVRSQHLKALDMLPQWIDLEVVSAAAPEDRTKIRRTEQMEYVSTAFTAGGQTPLSENNRSIQRMLIYDTNLCQHKYGGWVGTIKCDMRNLGVLRLDRGTGTEITIRASMHDYMYKGLGEFPSVQLGLLFS